MLIPDSTSSKVFSRWQCPAKVIEQRLPHSYIVELNGVNRHLQVDKLRKYHVSVQEVLAEPLQSDAEYHEAKVEHCAAIYEDDKHFGEVDVADTSPPVCELLPSQKIDPDKLKHLSDQQKKKLAVLLTLDPTKSFLQALSRAGMTLNIKKCEFAKSRVKFVGQPIDSGQRCVDPGRLKAVKNMKPPQSKKQVRQIMGFFAYFRDYIPNFSALAKPLIDLTAKRVPNQIPWGQAEQLAFEKLKTELCKATDESLAIVDFSKPFKFID